jgi:hypothetical protein
LFVGPQRHWKLWLNINCFEGGTQRFTALCTLHEERKTRWKKMEIMCLSLVKLLPFTCSWSWKCEYMFINFDCWDSSIVVSMHCNSDHLYYLKSSIPWMLTHACVWAYFVYVRFEWLHGTVPGTCYDHAKCEERTTFQVCNKPFRKDNTDHLQVFHGFFIAILKIVTWH